MIRNYLGRARDQFVADLREDPYLGYILLLAAVVMLFFIWHRLPNFATRDERWRVIDFYEVVAVLLENPTLEGLREGVAYYRSFGGTMVLYGLVTLPILGFAAYSGQLDAISAVLENDYPNLWDHWQSVPAWLWTSSVLAARLANALLAVGCVYLVYRIGTTLRNRWTGRLAAVLATFTWGLIMLAHEAGEDVPALFVMLLTVSFAVTYLDSGEPRHFLLGAAAGGVAISMKPTAGVGGVMLGGAHLLWMRREAARADTESTRPGLGSAQARAQLLELARPGLIGYGLLVSATALFVTYPAVVVNAPLAVFGLLLVVVAIPSLRDVWPASPSDDPDARDDGVTESGSGAAQALSQSRVAGLAVVAVLGVGLLLTNLTDLADGLEPLRNRLARGSANKSQSTHGWLVRPTWWWLVRGYLNGLGWPLFLAGIGGTLAALPRLRDRSIEASGVVVCLLGVATVLFVYSGWSYVRTHHLLLTFPLLVVLTAVALARLRVRWPDGARVLTAALVVTTALYAGAGTVGYANTPHDQAVTYLESNAGPNATIEVYTIHDPQEASVPHDMTVLRPSWGGFTGTRGRCPDYIQLTYQHSLMFLAPSDHSNWSKEIHSYQYYEDHFRSLLTDETDAYEVAGRYGPTPFFLRDGEPIDPTWNMLRAGIFPRTIQYGDPQDFGVYEYMVILERTGPCEG